MLPKITFVLFATQLCFFNAEGASQNQKLFLDAPRAYRDAKTAVARYEVAEVTDLCTKQRDQNEEACRWFDRQQIELPKTFENFLKKLTAAELDQVAHGNSFSISRKMKRPFYTVLDDNPDCKASEFTAMTTRLGKAWVKANWRAMVTVAAKQESLARPAYAAELVKIAEAKKLHSDQDRIMVYRLSEARDQSSAQINETYAKYAEQIAQVQKLAGRQPLASFVYQKTKPFPNCLGGLSNAGIGFFERLSKPSS